MTQCPSGEGELRAFELDVTASSTRCGAGRASRRRKSASRASRDCRAEINQRAGVNGAGKAMVAVDVARRALRRRRGLGFVMCVEGARTRAQLHDRSPTTRALASSTRSDERRAGVAPSQMCLAGFS